MNVASEQHVREIRGIVKVAFLWIKMNIDFPVVQPTLEESVEIFKADVAGADVPAPSPPRLKPEKPAGKPKKLGDENPRNKIGRIAYTPGVEKGKPSQRLRPKSAPLRAKSLAGEGRGDLGGNVERNMLGNAAGIEDALVLSNLSINGMTQLMDSMGGTSSSNAPPHTARQSSRPEWFSIGSTSLSQGDTSRQLRTTETSTHFPAPVDEPDNIPGSERHRFFHSTKLQAHATRRFSAAENKRLKGRVDHLQRKEAAIKKDMHDYYQLMEKRVKILREQKLFREHLEASRKATAKRNGKLNDQAKEIHRRLEMAKQKRTEELRAAARKTAEESKRNNEAYQNLKLKRIYDNHDIRNEVHRKRKIATKRALNYIDQKLNKVRQEKARKTRKENNLHKKRLKMNERLSKREAQMRELVDRLEEYKGTYEEQLLEMCSALEDEVCKLRREGRAKVVFSVPKQPKKDEEAGRAASNTGHRTSNKMPRIRRRGSVVTPRDRNTGKQRHRAHVPDSTPRSLGSLQLEHHLINKEEAHLTKFYEEISKGLKRKHFDIGQKYFVGDYVFSKAHDGVHECMYIARKEFTARRKPEHDIVSGNWVIPRPTEDPVLNRVCV